MSILAVIWQHAGGYFFSSVSWLALLTRGFVGVELFFVISGFLITTLLLRERDTYGGVSLKLFYARRALRIFPLYYTVLATYIVLVYLMEHNTGAGRLFFRNLPYYMTYTTNWFVDLIVNEDGQRRVIFIFAWSLATEEQFYLVWPSIFRVFRPPLTVVFLVATIVVDQVVSFNLLSRWIMFDHRTFVILTSISTPICLGVLTALVLHSPRGFGVLRRLFGRRWSSPAALALALAVLAVPLPDSPGWELTVGFTLTGLVAACVIREDHGLVRILASAPFQRIGLISYGMYMLHMLAMHVGEVVLQRLNFYNPLSRFLAGVGLTYVAASLSYRYYEAFFLRYKDRLARCAVHKCGVEYRAPQAQPLGTRLKRVASPDSRGSSNRTLIGLAGCMAAKARQGVTTAYQGCVRPAYDSVRQVLGRRNAVKKEASQPTAAAGKP